MKFGLVIFIFVISVLVGSVVISFFVSLCGLVCVGFVSSIVVLLVKLLCLWLCVCLIIRCGIVRLVGRRELFCRVWMVCSSSVCSWFFMGGCGWVR